MHAARTGRRDWLRLLGGLGVGVAGLPAWAAGPLAQPPDDDEAALSGSALPGAGRPVAAPQAGARWVDLQLLDGPLLRAAQLEREAVILYVHATWCPFCARQSPHIDRLYRQLDPQRLRLIGISLDRQADDVRRYHARHGYRFPVSMDAQAIYPLVGQRRVIPLVHVLGPGHVLRESVPGEMLEDDVMDLARHALPG